MIPLLSSPDRGVEGLSERTLTTAPNDRTTQQLQVLLDTIASRQRTKEQLMNQLGASRDSAHQVEPSYRKFKPEKYSSALEVNIDSWLAMLRIHMDCASSAQSDKILKVVNLLAKEARTFVLEKPPEDQDTVDKIFELIS